MSHQVGDYRIATLTVTPHDGSTSAVLTVTSPSGTISTPAVTESPSGTWTSAAYALSAAGRWVETWTVTGAGQGVETAVVLVSALPTAAPPGLISPADVEARLGRPLTDAEHARVGGLITDASALIRGYTRLQFTQVLNDTAVLRPVGSQLILPQEPVTAVDEVRGILADGAVSDPLTGWAWDGTNRIEIAGPFGVWPSDPWWPWSYGPDTFQVTYDHGSATVPDDVVAVGAAMVIRVLTSPSLVAGMVSERIGNYNYQLQQGMGATGAAVRLTEQDKDALSRYRVTARTVQVR